MTLEIVARKPTGRPLLRLDLVKVKLGRFCIQVALVIRGFFICKFAYSQLAIVEQTSEYAIFDPTSLAYPRFSHHLSNLTHNYTEKNHIKYTFITNLVFI